MCPTVDQGSVFDRLHAVITCIEDVSSSDKERAARIIEELINRCGGIDLRIERRMMRAIARSLVRSSKLGYDRISAESCARQVAFNIGWRYRLESMPFDVDFYLEERLDKMWASRDLRSLPVAKQEKTNAGANNQ